MCRGSAIACSPRSKHSPTRGRALTDPSNTKDDLTFIITRAQTGHAPSMDRLLQRIQEQLHRHILTLVRDEDVADDVLQEVLWVIARKLPQLNDPRWFHAWIYRIATREAVRRARVERQWRDALREEELLTVEEPAAEDSPFAPELLQLIVNHVDSLSPASGLVLKMHYLEELTYQEIAEALEVSTGTVKSRVAYGLAALRKSFVPEE